MTKIIILLSIFTSLSSYAEDCSEFLRMPLKSKIRIVRLIPKPVFSEPELKGAPPVFGVELVQEEAVGEQYIFRVDVRDALADNRLKPIFNLDSGNSQKNEQYRKRVVEDYERIVNSIQRGDKVPDSDDEKLSGMILTLESGMLCYIRGELKPPTKSKK